MKNKTENTTKPLLLNDCRLDLYCKHQKPLLGLCYPRAIPCYPYTQIVLCEKPGEACIMSNKVDLSRAWTYRIPH